MCVMVKKLFIYFVITVYILKQTIFMYIIGITICLRDFSHENTDLIFFFVRQL